MGDRAQLQPIDGGAAFRTLGDRLGTVELDEVLRQKEPWQREAAAAIRTNRGAGAWAEYQSRDAVAILPDATARRCQMVADYLQLLDHGRDVLMLAHRRGEVDALNRIAHAAALEEGRITDAACITVGDRSFSLGEPLVPRRRQRDVEREHRGTTTLENGDRMRLVAIDGKRMQLERESDQSRDWVDSDRYRDLDWGYAITAHRGQGLTADAALISGDPSAWAQLLYTLATRQREEIRFYGVEQPEEPGPRAEVAHPAAHDPVVPEPSWSQGMERAFQRWKPATTSLDFQRGDDLEIIRDPRGDAASIAPRAERDPWIEIVDVAEAAHLQEDVGAKKEG
jgi:ATP-dependent exoDNAse (exonuclease V) alpha subunit